MLSILGNSATQLLTNTFGTSSLSILLISSGVIVIIALLIWIVARWRSQPSVGLKLDNQFPPAKKRGLVLLVSNTEACQTAIEFHLGTLERCWLICSSQSQEKANALIPWVAELSNRTVLVEMKTISDVFNPIETYEAVQSIYQLLPKGWTVAEIISDFTGMTAQASIGMAFACMAVGGELQYTPANTIDGKLTGESLPPIAVTHQTAQFLQLP